MANAPVLIPKEQLPNCQVGEVLEITGEDETNFIVEPQYAEEAAAPAPGGEEMPEAVRAVMG